MKTSAVIRNALIVSLLFAVITPTSAVERICAEINHEISKDLNDKDRIAERTSMCFDGQVDKQLDREHPTLSMYEKADKNRTPVAVPSEALNPTDLKRMGVHVPAAERSAADEPTSIPVDRKSGAPRFEMLGERNHCSQVNVPHAGSGVDPIDGKTGNAQLPQQIATVQTDLRDVTEQARGQELVETVEAAAHEVAASAESDGRLLSRPYQGLPLAALGEHFERARKALADTADLLDQAEGGLPRGEIERFKRVFLNAKDKAEIGLGLARADEEARKGDQSLFQQLTVPPGGNPLARTTGLAEVFGGPGFGAATADGLVNRLVMLNGLPDDKKQTAFSKIKLGETVPVTLANGRSATISLLHNGYILGGGRTGLDCSSLVSSALPPDVRRGRFTTLDFRAMWIYRRTGYFMAPPQYHKERETLVREVANAFVPLDVYAGDRLIAGDLLVYRLPWESTGHVFVVRDFDGATTRATVIEAAQSAGTIREREFNLSPDSPRAHRRLLRPGLLALRLKPVTTSVCTYRTDRAGRTSLNNGGMPR